MSVMQQSLQRRAVLFALVLSLPALVGADDDAGPKSPKAKAALHKYDLAIVKAKQDYDRALVAASKYLNDELDEALKVAMKAENLDEAKRIDAAKAANQSRSPSKKDVLETLLGTWTVSLGDFHTEWTFRKDGTLTSSNGAPKGEYRIEKDRVVIRWDKDKWDSLDLPLDPKGSSGASYHPDRRVQATKKPG